MAITTNNNYKSPKKNMPVIKMSRGGEVSSMDYSERMEYIKNEILPKVSNTIKTFNIYSSGFSYDMNQDYKKTYEEIQNNYKSISDYDENSLDENTIYSVDGWEILRKEIDPDTNEVIDTQELEMVESGNTYNHSYLGLVDVNFRIYQDEEYGKYILIMHTHIGGDIRGNYDDALILIGDDKDELLYKFYEEFLNGVCTLILNFKDGSSLTFDSTQDSDIFNFEYIDEDDLEEGSTAHHVLKDFQSLSGYDADEFIENINNQFPESSTKMVSGGEIHDDRPQAYIQILGYPEGKWLDLTEFSNGSEVIDYITQWMNDLNEKTGGNREEYEVADYEGFGNIMFSQYMGETDFDEILEAYKEFENTDFPNEVVEQYFKDLGFKELTEVIGSMESNYYGRFDSNSDFAYEMVENESYVASERDMFVTDTDKRIIAGEEADNYTNYMDFEELLENAPNTKEKYEEEKDVLEYALDNASEDEYDKIIEEIDNLEEKYKSLAYEEVYDNHYESVYNKLENDLQDYLEEMGMNPNDASFVSIDYNKVADELMEDFHLIENNGDYYFFYAYKNGGKVSYINKPSKNNTHYVIELSLGKIVSGWENRDSAEEDRKALIMKYPKYKFGIYKKDKLKEKYNFDTITYNDFIDLSKIASEQEEDEKMNKSTKASLKNITHNKKSKLDNKVVNKEIEELNEKIYSKLKELLGSSSKDGEEKTEKIFQEIKELTKKKDRLAISHFQSTGYMYARGGRTRKLKKYFKRGKIGVNKALDYSREKYYQASDYAEKKDLKGKIKIGASKVLDKTKQGASWLQRQWREADFGDGKGRAKFFADGGGVWDKMTDEERKEYEKGKYIHYNIMNSRWQVWNGNESEEFWNQEQAEKFAGFEYDQDKDVRYSRNIYQYLSNGGGVGEFPPKGELTNKDNFLLKYEKKGSDYEFFVYKPITKEVSGYNQIKHVCLNKDCPQKMNYEQFIRYLYSELYLDDNKFDDGGGVEPYDEEKYSSEYDYLKKIITKNFGEKNTNYRSADWGGIDNWTIQGDMYEGVFIIIDDDRKVILMERKYNEELEENEDTDILYAEANDKSALQKLFNMASKIKYPLNKYADGGDTEEVYIEFLNKEKGFKKDTKYFNSYEEAVKWARKNLEKFNPDMIKYKYSDGGEMQEEKFRYKDFYQSQGGIKFKTEEEAERFIKTTKPFVRKQLREGNFVLVFNGKEYFIGEKIKINDEYADGGRVKKMYYHIIEYGDYGNIGYQGYYETKEEAQKQVDKLSDYFPNQTFQIFLDNSKKEPPITTMNNGGVVDGLTKQDFIDAYLKRVDSVIENLKQKGQYDSEDFDLLGEVDSDGGFTEIEDVGFWLDWAEINGNYDALIEFISVYDFSNLSHYTLTTLAHLFFGKPMKLDFNIIQGGDIDYAFNTELQKIKLLLNKIDFDKIIGKINYEEMENNTNLKFYKDGTLVMSLKGDYNDETDELDTTIDVDGETAELNYHPYDSMGGVNMEQLEKNINEAFKELKTYSAVVSIEGYEEYAEDVEGLENARATIQDIKGNTRFQVLKGSSVGIGKRVDDSRVVEEFSKGGETSKKKTI